jgi:signal transduction histidine kinase
VAAERLRIARELHDVVAHAMSVIAVQSGMGAHVIDTQPEEARRALANIEATSRSGLAELRRLLGVLRDDDADTGDGAGTRRPALAPAPGLGELDALVARASEAGLPVEVAIEGDARPLPPGVDLAAYRIVQEALTNVVKHAGEATARVTVRYGEAEVDLEIVDDGRGRAAAAGGTPGANGHGIAGMRERATIYNGTLDAGPRPEGGFRVAARLPLASR